MASSEEENTVAAAVDYSVSIVPDKEAYKEMDAEQLKQYRAEVEEINKIKLPDRVKNNDDFIGRNSFVDIMKTHAAKVYEHEKASLGDFVQSQDETTEHGVYVLEVESAHPRDLQPQQEDPRVQFGPNKTTKYLTEAPPQNSLLPPSENGGNPTQQDNNDRNTTESNQPSGGHRSDEKGDRRSLRHGRAPDPYCRGQHLYGTIVATPLGTWGRPGPVFRYEIHRRA